MRAAAANLPTTGLSTSSALAASLGGGLMFVALSLYHGWQAVMGPGLVDPDALVRMAQIRDFLSGHGWYELTQARLDAPFGIVVHWSRIVDVPVASLIVALSAVFERDMAEKLAITIWPSLLGFAYVTGVVAIATALAGQRAAWPAAVLALLCIHVRHTYAPGNIDHHNLQLVLTLFLAACLMRLDGRLLYGVSAALVAALMMAIGLETIAQVAVACIAVALAQSLDPARFGRGGLIYFLAFGAFSLATYLLFGATTGPGILVCDAFTYPYLAAVLTGSGGLAGANLWASSRKTSLLTRLALTGGVGFAALAVAGVLAPQCLGGPFAELDPELVRRWLADVDEARPLFSLTMLKPGLVVTVAGTLLSAVAMALIIFSRTPAERRYEVLILSALLAISIAVTLVQIRGTIFAVGLSLPFGAVLIVLVRDKVGANPGVSGQALLVLAWLFPQSLVYEGLGRGLVASGALAAPALIHGSDDQTGKGSYSAVNDCFDRGHYRAVAALPAAPVLASINLGAPLLAFTPHGVVAAPYHWQARGILDGLDAFAGGPDAARAIIERRQVAYVVRCQGDSLFAAAAAIDGSFAEGLEKGALPSWLVEEGKSGPLTFYRVKR